LSSAVKSAEIIILTVDTPINPITKHVDLSHIKDTAIKISKTLSKTDHYKIIAAIGGKPFEKIIGVLGLSFKAETDDIRMSPAISIIQQLLKKNIIIKAYDPKAIEKTKTILPNIEYCKDIYSTAENVEAIVILTEWNEFKELNFQKLATIMKNKIIIDLRNILNADEALKNGFKYISIG
jgi:UDPglucose 6-dehydrogenase